MGDIYNFYINILKLWNVYSKLIQVIPYFKVNTKKNVDNIKLMEFLYHISKKNGLK